MVPAGYGEDLAYIHDAGHSAFALGAAPWLLARLRGAGFRAGLVVDLGCGSGRWARELTAAGYDVLGVDLSEPMLEIARRVAPSARFVRGSFLDVDLPACVGVTSIGEVLGYAFDARTGRDELRRLFGRVHAALRPGGIFAFDAVGPGRAPRAPLRRHGLGPDWATLVEIEEDGERRELTRRITAFRRAGRLYRLSEEIHRLRLYERSEVLSDLAAAGFRARALRGYGGFRLPARHAAFLATRT